MFLSNLVEDVYLTSRVKDTWSLYISKKGSQSVLVATFYEEWHAIRVRHLFRLTYGLKPSEVSKKDYMYTQPQREAQIKERIHALNLKSHNKVVRQHEQLRERLKAVISPEQLHEWAARLLKEMK